MTLPGISVTIIMMITLALGHIMSAGFDQIFVMYNASVYETADIIDKVWWIHSIRSPPP